MAEKYNFQQQIITATAVNDSTNHNIVKYSAGGNKDTLQFEDGYCTKIIMDLQLLLNFTLNATVSDNYIKEENGTLVGIGQQLLSGSADIAIPLHYLLPFRRKYLYALQPLVREKILAIFRQPESTSIRDIYFGTFSTTLWAAVVVTLLLLYVTFSTFVYIQKSSMPPLDPFDARSNDRLDGCNCPLVVIAGITGRSWYHHQAEWFPLRIVSLLSFLLGYFLLVQFSATIITELSMERRKINTFSDLISHNFVILSDPVQQWGRYIAPMTKMKSQGEFLKEISSNFVSNKDSVYKSLRGGYAYLGMLDMFIPIARNMSYSDTELCKTVSSVSIGAGTGSGFYIAKNSALKEPFNFGLCRLMEGGLNSRHYKMLLTKSTLKCSTKDFTTSKESATVLGFRDVSTAFGFVYFGLISSCMFAIVEKMYFWHFYSNLKFVR